MDEDPEVAEFLRRFVRCRREPRSHPQPHVEEEPSADTETAERVVEAVPERDQTRERLPALRRSVPYGKDLALTATPPQCMFASRTPREPAP